MNRSQLVDRIADATNQSMKDGSFTRTEIAASKGMKFTAGAGFKSAVN